MTESLKKLPQMDPQSLIAKAVESGATIEVLERLVNLSERVRDASAKEAFQTAFVQFQAECPPIKKNKTARIATRSGSSYGYKYADLDEICRTISPVMQKYGLSWSWSGPRTDPTHAYVSCTVAHVHGHREYSGEVAMPIATADGTGGANPAQRVGIAITYARRYSLTGILGIAPEDDTDSHGSEEETSHKKAAATKQEEPPTQTELELAKRALTDFMNHPRFSDAQRETCDIWLGQKPTLAQVKQKLRAQQAWLKDILEKDKERPIENLDADPPQEESRAF